MKKTFAILAILLLVIIAAICLLSIFPSHGNPYKSQQENLAIEMGVKITDYPNQENFPFGYFYFALKPGMSLNEIHKIVRGYEKVYRCRTTTTGGPFYKEIYYYFSSEDLKPLRYQMFYDKQGKFTDFQGEDNNSRTISIEGCEEGAIDSN